MALHSQVYRVRADGGNDPLVKMECFRCEKRVYVYAESPEMEITIADLPCFCRHCGSPFYPTAIEYEHEWSPADEVKRDVRSEDE